MKNTIKKFGGVIFFYLAIVGMIIAINNRFADLKQNEEANSLAYIISE